MKNPNTMFVKLRIQVRLWSTEKGRQVLPAKKKQHFVVDIYPLFSLSPLRSEFEKGIQIIIQSEAALGDSGLQIIWFLRETVFNLCGSITSFLIRKGLGIVSILAIVQNKLNNMYYSTYIVHILVLFQFLSCRIYINL